MSPSNVTCVQCRHDPRSGTNFRIVDMQTMCFYASLKAIQGLTSLGTWLKADGEHRNFCELETCTTCLIGDLFHRMKSTKPSIIDYYNMQRICSDYALHSYDAPGFLECLLNSMSKEFLARFTMTEYFEMRIKCPKELFSISFDSSMVCLSCRFKSNVYQYLQRLELDIDESTTIDQALNRHFKPTVIDHICKSCKKNVKAEKKLKFSKQPIVLTFHGKTNQLVNVETQFSQEIFLSQCWLDGGIKDVKYRLESLIAQEKNGQHKTILFGSHSTTNHCLDDGCSFIAFYELENIFDGNCSIRPDVVASNENSNSSGNGEEIINLVDSSEDKEISEEDVSFEYTNAPLLDIMSCTMYLDAIESAFQSAFNLNDSFAIEESNDDIENLTSSTEKYCSRISSTENDSSSDSSDCSFCSYKSFIRKAVKVTFLPPKDPLDKYETTDDESTNYYSRTRASRNANRKILKRKPAISPAEPGRYVRARRM